MLEPGDVVVLDDGARYEIKRAYRRWDVNFYKVASLYDRNRPEEEICASRITAVVGFS
jgi:hypothetical protein